jgi:hypothetical protein
VLLTVVYRPFVVRRRRRYQNVILVFGEIQIVIDIVRIVATGEALFLRVIAKVLVLLQFVDQRLLEVPVLLLLLLLLS